MTKQHHPHKPLAAAVAGAMDFAGFEDWFEIFKAGEQTDSQGRTQTFTEADLDSIVANHSDAAAPLVVGHPKTNDPAYGWTTALKREGNTLFAKADPAAPEFEAAVKARHFPKRSVSLEPVDGGYRLRHIGFLGAVPPAVKGLRDIAFSQTRESVSFEYSLAEAAERTSWSISSIGRVLRGLREWVIADKGLDQANQLIPDYEIENIQRTAESVRSELEPQSYSSTDNSQESDMKQFSQADMDAAIAAARDEGKAQAEKDHQVASDYAERKRKADTLIKDAVARGALLPAQAAGMAEFMAGLTAAADQTFEFSASEGAEPTQVTPFDFMCDRIKALGKQVELGRNNSENPNTAQQNYTAPNGFTVDPERARLRDRAMEYAEKHGCDFVTAVQKVSKE